MHKCTLKNDDFVTWSGDLGLPPPAQAAGQRSLPSLRGGVRDLCFLWYSQGHSGDQKHPVTRGRRKRMWPSSKLLGLKIFQTSLAQLPVGDGQQPPPCPSAEAQGSSPHRAAEEIRRRKALPHVLCRSCIQPVGSSSVGPSRPSAPGSIEQL